MEPSDSPDAAEHRIAVLLTRYMDGARFDEEAARLDVARDMSPWLGLLLLRHLVGEVGWSPWWAIDDAVPNTLGRVDADTVEASGIAYLLGDSSVGWEQPFRTTLRLAPSRTVLSSYVLRFGDTAVGLGPMPADDRSKRRWPDVDDWLFTFVGGSTPGDICHTLSDPGVTSEDADGS